MKLFRFGQLGQEKPGVELADGKRLDVSAFGEDYNEAFFGNDGVARLQDWLAANGDSCPEVEASSRFGS